MTQGWLDLGDIQSANHEMKEATSTLQAHPAVQKMQVRTKGLFRSAWSEGDISSWVWSAAVSAFQELLAATFFA